MRLDRRKTLTLLGGAGVAAWAAPQVLSIPAAAAASCACSDGGANLVRNPVPTGYTPNALTNAEYDPNVPVGTAPGAVPDQWTTTNGFRVITYGSIDYPATAPTGGSDVLFSGSLDAGSASPGTATQDWALASDCFPEIDAGTITYDMSAYLGGASGEADTMQFDTEFLDAATSVVGTATLGPTAASAGFTLHTTSGTIPATTRSLRFTLTATKLGPAHARNTASAALLEFVLCG
ncbi:MAG: hypothetical protein KDB33_07280 [Acidimicrobiales bacterium]|nr:hypothetical protein [Acidimicrobiales bacterium]